MKYAALLYPHQNIRYRESLLKITQEELRMTLQATGCGSELEARYTGNAPFLIFETEELLRDWQRKLLERVAGIYVLFQMEEGGLQPMEPLAVAYLKEDFPALLKYKGKTNEMFTDAMMTMALASSDFSRVADSQLVVCDPMGGKGTTAMLALCHGYHGISVEISKSDHKEATDYVSRYLEFHKLKHKRTEAALTLKGQLGGREVKLVLADTQEHFKEGDTRTLRFIQADTQHLGSLLKPESVHLMITDLPYGVQKGTSGKDRGILQTVRESAAGWTSVLKKGGVLAVSFNANVTHRKDLAAIFEECGLTALQTANLRHWVETAIDRDILLVKKTAER